MTVASVIIRCLNEERDIGTLLDRLAAQTLREFEIIVVDSGSTDRTLDIVAEHDCRVLHIDPADFSFGASLNRGCEAAQGQFLVMISAHVYPDVDDWLARLVQGFDDAEVGVVYGAQRGNEVTRFSEHQIFRKWFPDEPARQVERAFCNNANCAVRRELWQQLRYDEELTGLEDIDFAKRAIARGHAVLYDPTARAIHVHDESYGQILNRYRREAIALQRIMPNEHFGFGNLLDLWLRNVLSDAAEARREGKLLRELLGIIRFRWAQFWGTYRGFRQRKALDSELKRHLYYPNP